MCRPRKLKTVCKLRTQTRHSVLGLLTSRMVVGSKVGRSQRTRHARWINQMLLGSVRCFWMVQTRLCSTEGAFVVKRVSTRGLSNGRFWKDGAQARWETCLCFMWRLYDCGEGEFLHRLPRLAWNDHVTSECSRLNHCCFWDPIDGFFLVKLADAWWRRLKFEQW